MSAETRKQFKESDDVGRSLARDQKRDSKNKPKRGEGDEGDHWTTEDFELLAASVKEGRPIAEIAKSMGRSQEAVRCKAWQGGLLPPRKKKQMKQARGLSE